MDDSTVYLFVCLFDMGCNMRQVKEPQVIQKILPVPHQKVSPMTEQLPSISSWKIRNTTEWTTEICFQELSHAELYLTLQVTVLVRFENTTHYKKLSFTSSENSSSGSTSRHEDMPHPRVKHSV